MNEKLKGEIIDRLRVQRELVKALKKNYEWLRMKFKELKEPKLNLEKDRDKTDYFCEKELETIDRRLRVLIQLLEGCTVESKA